MFTAHRNVVATIGSIILALTPLSAVAQYSTQGAPATQPVIPATQPVVILFIAPITGDTIPHLMSVVTAQVSKGVDNITIAISSSGGDTGAGFGAYNGRSHSPMAKGRAIPISSCKWRVNA
jgi:hypothetical protein